MRCNKLMNPPPKTRNRELEAKLLMAGTGKRDTMPTKQKVTEQVHRVIEKRDLGSPETIIIHVGTNDLRTTRNLDFVMGEICAFVATAKRKLLNCRLVLRGVLRPRDVSWRCIGALNDRYDWIANALDIC